MKRSRALLCEDRDVAQNGHSVVLENPTGIFAAPAITVACIDKATSHYVVINHAGSFTPSCGYDVDAS